MATAAGRSAGSARTTAVSASTPPADAPITIRRERSGLMSPLYYPRADFARPRPCSLLPAAARRQPAQRPQLEAQLPDERQVGHAALEQRKALLVVLEAPLELRLGERDVLAGGERAQLARLGELVGRVDGERVGPRRLDLSPQRRLARAVAGDRRVLGDGGDERGRALAEARAHVVERRVGLLDDVVQEPRGHHVVLAAAPDEQRGDLERVQQEGRLVGVAPLRTVPGRGERGGLLEVRAPAGEGRHTELSHRAPRPSVLSP